MSSNRLAIGQALQAFLAGVVNPNTGLPLFALSKLGSVYDPTGFSSFIEVTYMKGTSSPVGSGGNQIGWRIEDTTVWSLSAGWPYASSATSINSTDAMTSMLTAMDILVPTLHQHYQFPLATNPSLAIQSVFSFLVEPQDRSRLVVFPNGTTYIMYEAFVTVKQQYGVNLVSP